jgi:peptidoglycan/LPS O-acetylase OafA/YrhL
MPLPVIDPPSKAVPADQLQLDRAAASERTRIAALTGLRGFAVLLIVLQHSWLTSHRDGTPFIDHWFKSFNGLWIGVDLFFVLSGYLLTRILLEAKGQPNYFRNFYMRRCLRIFPVYYGLILVAVVAGLVERCHSWSELPWIATFLTNVSISLQHSWSLFLAGIPVCHLWSLSVEEHFYFVWPFVVKKSTRHLFWLCVAGIAATTILRCIYLSISHDSFAINIVHVLTPFRMDGILAGAAVACIHQNGSPTRKQAQIALAIGSCMFIALGITTHFDYSQPLLASIGYTAIAIAAASLVSWLISATAQDRLSKACSNSALMFFGRYSYAIYLLHLPVATYFNHQIRAMGLGTSPLAVVSLGMIAPFICTVLLSLLSWHLLEKHALKLKTRFC